MKHVEANSSGIRNVLPGVQPAIFGTLLYFQMSMCGTICIRCPYRAYIAGAKPTPDETNIEHY